MTTSLAYMHAQGLEPTITKTLKQVVHEKPSNAALRLGELLKEQCAAYPRNRTPSYSLSLSRLSSLHTLRS